MRLRADLGISLLLLLVLALAGWVGWLGPPSAGPTQSTHPTMGARTPGAGGGLAGKLIVVDPGHSRRDRGAVGVDGSREEVNTLAIGMDLAKLLRGSGVDVVLTRTTAADPAEGTRFAGRSDASLAARVALAEAHKADAFVSIHNNWSADATARGTATYYERPESWALASAIQRAEVDALGSNDRGVRYGNFEVVRDTTMPAVLVEVGFVSNAQEAAALGTPAYRARAAQGIYAGLRRYFDGA